MQNEANTLFVFMKDDGFSLQYSNGQCAGYRLDGTLQIFSGKDNNLFPRKVVILDRRKANGTPEITDDKS
ncbi:Fur-regulated protein [Atlantibacter subterraneus]|uniref:Fur-regulated protein n=1 Tax=Atlantibacter subterraneus TaxID=255519 RepID=A0ABU4E527_9ENTR|nr:Fur-regulated protein [Atlantibacter subterranea]MDV7023719.1 Fur-regulated protein [Atlantibacter subterranea]